MFDISGGMRWGWWREAGWGHAGYHLLQDSWPVFKRCLNLLGVRSNLARRGRYVMLDIITLFPDAVWELLVSSQIHLFVLDFGQP